MALSADTSRITRGDNACRLGSYPGTNANVFYKGAYAFLDNSTGLVVEAADTANFNWLGMVREKVTADGAQGDSEVKVMEGGFTLVKVNVTGVDNINDVGDLVYATADDTLTLTATTNTKAIGYVSRYYGSSTLCDVKTFTPGESRAL